MRIALLPLILGLGLALCGQEQSQGDLLRVTQVNIEKRSDPSGREFYTAKVEMYCNSSKAITAYALSYTINYADGTVKKRTQWEDLVPTLPLTGATLLSPGSVHVGPLRTGDTQVSPLGLAEIPSKAPPSNVNVEVTAIVFDDCTTLGKDEKSIDWIFAERRNSLKLYQTQLNVLDEALRTVPDAQIIALLRSRLQGEKNGLTKQTLMKRLDSSGRQISERRLAVRSWLESYEKELRGYIAAYEPHQTKKEGRQ